MPGLPGPARTGAAGLDGPMFGGKFKNRQPESLSEAEWTEIRDYLVDGKADGWSLS